MKLLVAISSILLIWLAGFWAFIFWLNFQTGEVLLHEYNRAIRITEFWLAVIIVVYAVVTLLVSLKK